MDKSSALPGAPRDVQDFYQAFCREVSKWPGVEVHPVPSGAYIRFRYCYRGHCRNFAEVYIQTRNHRLLVVLRRETTNLPPGTTATVLGLEVERVPESRQWTAVDHRVAFHSKTDLGSVIQLTRRSYEAARAEVEPPP